MILIYTSEQYWKWSGDHESLKILVARETMKRWVAVICNFHCISSVHTPHTTTQRCMQHRLSTHLHRHDTLRNVYLLCLHHHLSEYESFFIACKACYAHGSQCSHVPPYGCPPHRESQQAHTTTGRKAGTQVVRRHSQTYDIERKSERSAV